MLFLLLMLCLSFSERLVAKQCWVLFKSFSDLQALWRSPTERLALPEGLQSAKEVIGLQKRFLENQDDQNILELPPFRTAFLNLVNLVETMPQIPALSAEQAMQKNALTKLLEKSKETNALTYTELWDVARKVVLLHAQNQSNSKPVPESELRLLSDEVLKKARSEGALLLPIVRDEKLSRSQILYLMSASLFPMQVISTPKKAHEQELSSLRFLTHDAAHFFDFWNFILNYEPRGSRGRVRNPTETGFLPNQDAIIPIAKNVNDMERILIAIEKLPEGEKEIALDLLFEIVHETAPPHWYLPRDGMRGLWEKWHFPPAYQDYLVNQFVKEGRAKDWKTLSRPLKRVLDYVFAP